MRLPVKLCYNSTADLFDKLLDVLLFRVQLGRFLDSLGFVNPQAKYKIIRSILLIRCVARIVIGNVEFAFPLIGELISESRGDTNDIIVSIGLLKTVEKFDTYGNICSFGKREKPFFPFNYSR